MDKTELLAIWNELKSMRELMFQLEMQSEGILRALETANPAFKNERLTHEKAAIEFYRPSLRDGTRAIDAAIQRLESS